MRTSLSMLLLVALACGTRAFLPTDWLSSQAAGVQAQGQQAEVVQHALTAAVGPIPVVLALSKGAAQGSNPIVNSGTGLTPPGGNGATCAPPTPTTPAPCRRR